MSYHFWKVFLFLDKIQTIEKLFTYILVYSYLLLPLFFLFSKFKKDKTVIVLAIYGLLFFFFLNFYYDFPKSFRKVQQSLYTLLEYSFFAYILWHSIQNIKIRKIIVSLSITFFVFQVIYLLISKPQKIDSVPIAVETILLFVYAFVFFQQSFKYNLNLNLYQYANFWLVVGILIYLGSSFFFNILGNHVTQEQMDDYWHLTFIPEILKNILFALVILGSPFKILSTPKYKSADIPNLDMI